MFKSLSVISALVLCISFICAFTSTAFILVGRNGVGRGESLKGSMVVDDGDKGSDITGNNGNMYFGSTNNSGTGSKDTSNSNASGAINKIAKCRFTAGSSESKKDEHFPSFYVPSKDKELYESGVKELLSQAIDEKSDAKSGKPVAANTPSIALECEDVNHKISNINCRLCMYNEISKDKKHLRQGQVLDVSLDSCIFGNFGNSMNVLKDSNNNYLTDYHPICYPPASSTSNNSNNVGAKNMFGKTVDAANKYEVPTEFDKVAYLVGESLLNAVLDNSSNAVSDIGEPFTSFLSLLPDELVLTEAAFAPPQVEYPEFAVDGGDNQNPIYLVVNADMMEDNINDGEGLNAIYDNIIDRSSKDVGDDGDYMINLVSANRNRFPLLDDSEVVGGRELQDLNKFARSSSQY